MEQLVRKVKRDYPHLEFVMGAGHCWSPRLGQIFYAGKNTPASLAGLLHELGHARLEHKRYESDLELLQKEVAAWDEARQLANEYDVAIDEDHIQDCLDTYRDWFYRRSTCPKCRVAGLQQPNREYFCLNCAQTWRVSPARFCRPYRLSVT